MDNALAFISTALLIFAAIALFVGGFTIFNTLSITVGQRTREPALLRLVGAGRRQVFGSVLGEAAFTGLIASLIGLGLGVVAALGLKALLRHSASRCRRPRWRFRRARRSSLLRWVGDDALALVPLGARGSDRGRAHRRCSWR